MAIFNSKLLVYQRVTIQFTRILATLGGSTVQPTELFFLGDLKHQRRTRVSEIPTSEAAKVASKFHHRFNGDWMGGTLITNKWWFNSWMFTGSWSQAIHVRRSWGPQRQNDAVNFLLGIYKCCILHIFMSRNVGGNSIQKLMVEPRMLRSDQHN
jgi:hypothetical protein